MDLQSGDVAQEIKRLQRCINDLVSLFALPAMWSGGEPSQIVHTLLDALLRMLQLDLVYVRLRGTGGRAAVEMVRFSPSQEDTVQPREIGECIQTLVGGRPSAMASADAEPDRRPGHFDPALGIGAARRNWRNRSRVGAGGFPASNRETDSGRSRESGVHRAARGAAAKRTKARRERTRSTASRKRTAELAAANEELREEIADRNRAEEAFHRVERQARAIVDSALDAVVVMDAQGVITDWNKQAEETFGWSRSDAVGQRMVDTIIPMRYRLPHERGLEHFFKTGRRSGSEPANRNYRSPSRWHGVSGGADDHAAEIRR